MKKRFNSIFDIIGPVMVGPSSSHTAGAVRLAYLARWIFNEKPKKVIFYLYGSFAETYRGHGTDCALVGGMLGMRTDNPLIASSMYIATEAGLEFSFIPLVDNAKHPNTVKIIMTSENGTKMSLEGRSVGGGNVELTKLDGLELSVFNGISSLILIHRDTPGMIAKVSTILGDQNINIATMKVERTQKGEEASMVIELDQNTHDVSLSKIRALENVQRVICIPKDLEEKEIYEGN